MCIALPIMPQLPWGISRHLPDMRVLRVALLHWMLLPGCRCGVWCSCFWQLRVEQPRGEAQPYTTTTPAQPHGQQEQAAAPVDSFTTDSTATHCHNHLGTDGCMQQVSSQRISRTAGSLSQGLQVSAFGVAVIAALSLP